MTGIAVVGLLPLVLADQENVKAFIHICTLPLQILESFGNLGFKNTIGLFEVSSALISYYKSSGLYLSLIITYKLYARC